MAARQPVLGVTKCPECRRPLEGQPIIVREVQEYPWRTSPSGHTYRSLTPATAERRWHQACWDQITHDLERSRLLAEVQRWEDVAAVSEMMGTPVAARVVANLAEAREALELFHRQEVR